MHSGVLPPSLPWVSCAFRKSCTRGWGVQEQGPDSPQVVWQARVPFRASPGSSRCCSATVQPSLHLLPCSAGFHGVVLGVGSSPLAAGIYCCTVSYTLLEPNCCNEIQYLLEIVTHICRKCNYYVVFICLRVLLQELSSIFSLCAVHQSCIASYPFG